MKVISVLLVELQHAPPQFLYHGTSSVNIRSIMKHGIRGPSCWSNREEVADYYAEDETDRVGGKMMVLRVPFARFNKSAFEPDMPSLEEPITTVIGKSEEEVWEEWQSSDGSPMSALEISGGVLYKSNMSIQKSDVVW